MCTSGEKAKKRAGKMSLRKYFKPVSMLPTPEKIGLSTLATTEANKAIERALESERETKAADMKRKYTSTFTPENHAENGNARASKKYCHRKYSSIIQGTWLL